MGFFAWLFRSCQGSEGRLEAPPIPDKRMTAKELRAVVEGPWAAAVGQLSLHESPYGARLLRMYRLRLQEAELREKEPHDAHVDKWNKRMRAKAMIEGIKREQVSTRAQARARRRAIRAQRRHIDI